MEIYTHILSCDLYVALSRLARNIKAILHSRSC